MGPRAGTTDLDVTTNADPDPDVPAPAAGTSEPAPKRTARLPKLVEDEPAPADIYRTRAGEITLEKPEQGWIVVRKGQPVTKHQLQFSG